MSLCKQDNEDIYALGDAIEVINPIINKKHMFLLQDLQINRPELLQIIFMEKPGKYNGTIGSSILKIFDNNLGMVGINENTAKINNIDYKTMIITPSSHATYYPGATRTTYKSII